MKILITNNGTIISLYNDILREVDLGLLKVKRASNVEFNNDTQLWDIDILGEGIIGSFKTRKEAIDFEIEFLEKRIEESILI